MTTILLQLTERQGKKGTDREVWVGAHHIIFLRPLDNGETELCLDTPPESLSPTRPGILTRHMSRLLVKESPEEIEEQLRTKAERKPWPPQEKPSNT